MRKSGASLFSAGFRLLAAAGLPLLGGCSEEAARSTGRTEPAYSRQYRSGALTVVLAASETNLAVSGRIRLALDVQAPPGAEVVFPDVDNLAEPFAVEAVHTEPVRLLPNGKLLHRQTWDLVPRLPGDAELASMEIRGGPVSIATDPVAVGVRSLLPDGLDALEIRDIAGLAVLPSGPRRRLVAWWRAAGVSALLLLAVLAAGHLRRAKPQPPPEPHEAALAAMEGLPADPMQRLGALVRILAGYLEARYGLPVAGRTVPEIVPLIPHYPLLGRRARLVEFLVVSEQVRFSERMPPDYAGEAEQYIRRFIEETKDEAPCG